MKLLLVSDTFPQSKPAYEQIDFNLALHWAELGHEVHVATVHDVEPTLLLPKKIQYHKVSSGKKKQGYVASRLAGLIHLGSAVRLYNLQRKYRFDIVNVHKINRSIAYSALVALKLSGAKIVYTAHDVQCFTNHLLPAGTGTAPSLSLIKKVKRHMVGSYVRFAIARSNMIIAVSGNLQTVLQKNQLQNVEVVYNGVNVPFWQQKIHKADVGTSNILYVGLIDSKKSFTSIVRAVEQIAKTDTTVVLRVAGTYKDSEYYESICQDIAAQALQVEFLGRLSAEDLIQQYDWADCVVTFSIINPFSMVALEAGAMKKPVVWGCASGYAEVTKLDQQFGFVADLGLESSIRLQVTRLITDTSYRQQCADWNYSRVQQHFDAARQAQQYIDVFNDI